MMILVLALLSVSHALVVRAAPPPAPVLGFTPTVPPTVVTPTPGTPTIATPTTLPPRCIPVIAKQAVPDMARPGDEVIFVIEVTNEGRAAAVDARVIDTVPAYLEILEVTVTPSDQGQEVMLRRGQTVVVDVGTIGQGYEVTIVIRTRMRQDAPSYVCVENLAEFRAPNCPDRSAAIICTLPESGGTTTWWMVASALGACLLALGLALAKRSRA
jgi:uncharacterized repeat protein (TIGR01451 family)/LPXTG-motif cell wall-anchored protein